MIVVVSFRQPPRLENDPLQPYPSHHRTVGWSAMGKRVHRAPYSLDTKGIQELPFEDIKAILRGADDLIGTGGHSMLVKVLRGSRMKKVLELELDQSPVYGHFRDLPEDDVLARVDWMIRHGYLAIEYDYRLPILVYTRKGWEIERETYAEELLEGFDERLREGPPYDMADLKDRERQLILLLLDKVEASRDRKYLPLLEAWKAIDYRKVRERIGEVMAGITADA